VQNDAFLALAREIERYDDGQIQLSVEDRPVNGYLLIRLAGSGIDNYNVQLFQSVLAKIVVAGMRKVAFDLRNNNFIASKFFETNLLGFGAFLAKIGGNLVIGGLTGRCAEFVRLMGFDGIMNFPIDTRSACETDIPLFRGASAMTSPIGERDRPHLIAETVREWNDRYRSILAWRSDPWNRKRSETSRSEQDRT
jgi:hypothetical protein